MGENATKRLPVTPTTKARIEEVKDDQEPFDLWIRRQAFGDDV